VAAARDRYSAPLWLRNAHVQSVLSSLPLRRSAAQRVLERTGAQTTPMLVDAGDGVRLQGFHDTVPGRAPRALVLLLHGWEGSSESAYMRLTAARLVSKGMDVFRLNFRDHGDTHHLNEGLFHSCRLAEVVAAAKDVSARFSGLPFMAAGYSLGGNFALRLALAAPAAGLPLLHSAAVCPGVDPSAVMKTLESGAGLYNWYFMKRWRSSLRKKRALWPQQHDFDDAVLQQDMRSLTRWLALKHTDFTDVEDYFDGYSVSEGRLAALQVPVSVLASADDPVIPVDTLRALQLPAHSHLDIAEHGGHCGFIEGPSLRGYAERWVARRLLRALSDAR
jgi:predicted alpha/beta-fold hydrolase